MGFTIYNRERERERERERAVCDVIDDGGERERDVTKFSRVEKVLEKMYCTERGALSLSQIYKCKSTISKWRVGLSLRFAFHATFRNRIPQTLFGVRRKRGERAAPFPRVHTTMESATRRTSNIEPRARASYAGGAEHAVFCVFFVGILSCLFFSVAFVFFGGRGRFFSCCMRGRVFSTRCFGREWMYVSALCRFLNAFFGASQCFVRVRHGSARKGGFLSRNEKPRVFSSTRTL